MRRSDGSFENNIHRSRKVRENVVNSNFTREDYVEHCNVVNYLLKLFNQDTVGYNSTYPFIVVWQKHE